MKFLTIILVLCSSLAWGSSDPLIPNVKAVSRSPFSISGVNINMYGRNRFLGASDYQQSLNDLVSTGSNTAMVTTPYVQATATSSSVYADPNITETDANLATLFDALKARGFTVAYKFTLLPSDGSWSGHVHPANTAAWFASYKSNLVRLAALSQAHGVTLLYVVGPAKPLNPA